MRRLTLLLTLLVPTLLNSQSCLPEGITFTTQVQIDSFQTYYPGCTEIEGNVSFFSHPQVNDITNLEGLSILTSIKGNLDIYGCYHLSNLSGLEGLTSIGGNLNIRANNSLDSLTGLDNLTTVGGSVGIEGYMALLNITDLTGLNKLHSIGGNFEIHNNLESLKGLDSLTSIGGDFRIGGPTSLTSLEGPEKLTTIGGDLYIGGVNMLTSLSGLEELHFIKGDLHISDNDALTSLNGLENIDPDSLDNLYIFNNNSLASCEAESICSYLNNPTGSINIFNNAIGFNNPSEAAKSCGFDLGCLPYGNYILWSQTEIDSFQSNYPGCSHLEGEVVIGYPLYGAGQPNDISDLGGLEILNSIGGDLSIRPSNTLTSLSGLDNLTYIGGALDISGSITSLTGLGNLTSVGDWMIIGHNNSLINLEGLENLVSIGNNLYIGYNSSLTSLSGLENVTSFGGDIWIENNNSLLNLTILDNWTAIEGGLIIMSNDALTSLTELENLTSIGGSLEISGNEALTSLTGLENLSAIGGSFSVSSNTITSLAGLVNLNSIGENFWISNNDSLNTLTGLESLDFVGGDLTIRYNSFLINLSGLENIEAASINNLYIYDNIYLSTCNVKSVCDYLASPNGLIEIHDNAIGCDSQQEVEEECGTSVPNEIVKNDMVVYPNPFTTSTSIKYTLHQPSDVTLSIFNHLGKQVDQISQHQQSGKQSITWQPQELASGIYFYTLRAGDQVATGKMMLVR